MSRSLLGVLLALPFFVSTTGCGTTTATVAAAGAATATGIWGANLVATRSKLEVKVEHFDRASLPQKDQALFQQPTIAIEDKTKRPIDVVQQPTAPAIREVMKQASPEVKRLEQRDERLGETLEGLERLRGPDAADEFLNAVLRDFRAIRESNAKVLATWRALKLDFEERSEGGIAPEEVRELAERVKALRGASSRDRQPKVSSSFFEYLRLRLQVSALNIVEHVGDESKPPVNALALRLDVPADDVEASFRTRTAAVVKPFLDGLFAALTPDERGKEDVLEPIVEELRNVGIAADRGTISRLVTAGGGAASLEEIAAVLGPLSLPIQVAEAKQQVHQATFVVFGVDFNVGPIRDELIQVLLTSDAIAKVLENDGQWREFSYAESKGAVGNHDAIVYFENLGLPVLKSSAFDPTKFQVANGLLFRRVVSTLADVAGLPTDIVPGDGDAATPVGSLNLARIRAEQQKAQNAAAASQKKILGALKSLIESAKKLRTMPSTNEAEREALKAAAKKLFEDAAKLLAPTEASASSPNPDPQQPQQPAGGLTS